MFLDHLKKIWSNVDHPFLQTQHREDLRFKDIDNVSIKGLDSIQMGDVVALIGDFDAESIAALLNLLSRGAIVVPLTSETRGQHDYFTKQSYVQYILEKNNLVTVISSTQFQHPLLNVLRKKEHPGLILFTTGTTGRPKAILHDFVPFISRYKTPRPPLKAISFLLFDHIGGINTLLHMLFNIGQIVSIQERTVESVANIIKEFSVELLPTTPTFLRMVSLHPGIEDLLGSSLKIISYGTERMDQPTLQRLCDQFPKVDFRQTYGMSELGILRIKSKSKSSLFMSIGGEGVETKIVDDILYIKADNRMLGYLNASSPFDEEGWYCTKDIVRSGNDGYLTIIGRDSDVVNIGGLKFVPSEVERVCLEIDNVKFAKAFGVSNSITGQHLEINIELESNNIDEEVFKREVINVLRARLPRYMVPSRIRILAQTLSHRFKKL
jgi:acyl-CoA synthetase (AMP-forming)/AMP-acid ligase II